MPNAPVLIDSTAGRIFAVRGKRVILDADLAGLYGVPTKRLNKQVRRNLGGQRESEVCREALRLRPSASRIRSAGASRRAPS